MASTGNAKALIGAIFLQYCSYAIFYLMDELNGISPSNYKALVSEQEAQPVEEDPPVSSSRGKKKKKPREDMQMEGGSNKPAS